MHSLPRYIAFKKGGNVPIIMPGEIHGDVEHGQQGVYCADTENRGAGGWRGFRRIGGMRYPRLVLVP